MKHLIEATVLRVEFIRISNNKSAAFNIPIYPWDNLNQIKSNIREAAKQTGQKITHLYKTKRQIGNPLLEG